ncbi:DUF4145 domain-containing protein [Acetobacter sp.]|uniref:DUF4145 domain-containing protein n=1 Tax=Acetobacter sp. TaxID=440 RepID=UPI0039E8D355
MATLTFDCPICFAQKMTFDISGVRKYQEYNGRDRCSVAAFCRGCSKSIGLIAEETYDAMGILEGFYRAFSSGVCMDRYCTIISYWPARNIVSIPEHVSENVARIYSQAERNRAQLQWDAAGTMYRKVLEAATKELGADLKAEGNLMRRIDLLEAQGRLTQDLAQWAHTVRLLGNEAAHDEAEPAPKDVDDLANLTRMLLIYLFELPKRVAAMRAEGRHTKALPAPDTK